MWRRDPWLGLPLQGEGTRGHWHLQRELRDWGRAENGVVAEESLAGQGPGGKGFDSGVEDLAGAGEVLEVMGERAGLLRRQGCVCERRLRGVRAVAPGEGVDGSGGGKRLRTRELVGGIEAEILVGRGQDDVVVEGDAEEVQGRDDVLGDLPVVGGGDRSAGRMVVEENDPGGLGGVRRGRSPRARHRC